MIIPVDEIDAGMILTEPVFSRNGQVLLNDGATLSERHKFIFKNRGISVVSIRGGDEETLVISDDTRMRAKRAYVQRLVDPPTHSLEKEVSTQAIDCLAVLMAQEEQDAATNQEEQDTVVNQEKQVSP